MDSIDIPKEERGLSNEKIYKSQHCHFELEAAVKPCQCPDCGKPNRICTATLGESKEFQARKLKDVWKDSTPALAG